MELSSIDASSAELQTEAEQTVAALTTLAGKLQAAAAAGDPNAREWMLDLKEIALGVQGERNETTTLLQTVHAYLDEHAAPARRKPPTPPSRSSRFRVAVGCSGSWGAGSAGPSRRAPGSGSATT